MFKALTITPVNISTADVSSIVAKASFLWERLDAERFWVDHKLADQVEIDRRCDRWCKVIGQGSWNIVHKRLQWDGLDFDTIRPYLGTVRLNSNQFLPEWAETLQQIMQTAVSFDPQAEILLPIDTKNPFPFEDVLLPAVKVARQKLLTRLQVTQLAEDRLPLSMFSTEAYHTLEHNLLQQLSMLSTKTLNFEFSHIRPFGQSLLSLIGIEDGTDHRKTYYNKFVHQLLKDGLSSFFQKYPVLARLMGTVVNFWVEATIELIQRLSTDQEAIQNKFGRTTTHQSLGKVVEVSASLSDPHHQGRTVSLLTFESGLKLVYKPKNLGLEVAYNEFLDWCNRRSQLLDFKIIQVLNCGSYGWVEFVEHQACADEAAAQRFYQRAGMLLCLLYALRGTDCHNENLIATGEYLVLIDMETLLHHDANMMENSPIFREMETDAGQEFWNSVLRTGMLPHWDFSADRRIAYDISGLGSTSPQQSPQPSQRWQAINTDDMHLQSEAVALPIGKNVPLLDDVALSPNDYQKQIATGFEQMYRFLVAHKEALRSPSGPLATLQHQSVRFVFRPTRIYFSILERTWTPEYLKDGADFSIELEHLSCAFLVAQKKPDAWPVLIAELRAMEQLDVPFFTASAASDTLGLEDIQEIHRFFKRSSYQQVLNQLETLNETDLARQVAIIEGSLYARVAQTSSREGGRWQTVEVSLLSTEELVEEAKAIATEIEARAIQEPNGSLNWIGMGFVPGAGCSQLQVLGDNLYDGRCGVALFLAAVYKVTGEQRFRQLALGALSSLHRQMQVPDAEFQQRVARFTGVGGASGLGSMIYSLVKMSQFLEDEALLTDAQSLASLITPELIEADKYLDVIAGSAGAILGLLSLYRVTGRISILERARSCGQRLLNQQVGDEGSPKAWFSFAERPLTGFSHGAAGIAYALLQLYSVTQDQAFLKAALQGIDYERSFFSKTEANWPDLRQQEPPNFLVQWCYGASGIGLGRLGSLEIINTPDIQQEIEIALRTTQNYGLDEIDHLCCGNLGRSEVLLVGAQRLSRLELRQLALQQVTTVVNRAKQAGGYQLFSNLPNTIFNPGFFQGVSGIGYELLRFADDLPSILLWE